MFNIRRGTNISHWLSQSKLDRAERAAYFTHDDLKVLADKGFDHLRMPVDEQWMWHSDGTVSNEGFDFLQGAIDWCKDEGMRIIVDLHILRTHYFNDAKEPLLFTDPSEPERFAGLWRDLSRELRSWSTDHVAYELLNEPVARDNQDWNRAVAPAFAAVRALEPDRTIVLGSNRFSSTQTFGDLLVPQDKHMILTFHFYNPMFLTHYRASWWEGGAYEGPVMYPGKPVDEAVAGTLDEPLKSIVRKWNVYYDRDKISEEISLPLSVARTAGAALYCGEFGCISRAPEPYRTQWYHDMISVFSEFGIAWANWDFRGEFGLYDRLTRRDTGLASVLLKEP